MQIRSAYPSRREPVTEAGSQSLGVGDGHVEEVLADAGEFTLGEGEDRHEVESTGQRLGAARQRVESGRPCQQEAARLEVGVDFDLDRVENVGHALVLVDERGAWTLHELARISEHGTSYRRHIEVQYLGVGRFGDLVEHRRLADRTGALQHEHGHFAQTRGHDLDDAPVDPSVSHVPTVGRSLKIRAPQT